MPKKSNKTNEERLLYDSLYNSLIPLCTVIYRTADSKNNVVAQRKLNNGISNLVSTASMAAFAALCNNCTDYANKLNEYAKRVDQLYKIINMQSSSLGEAVEICNEVFDNYETDPEFIIGVGQKLLDLSDDIVDEISSLYYTNIKNIEEKLNVDLKYTFSYDLMVFLITIGVLKPNQVGFRFDMNDASVSRLFKTNVIDLIYANSRDITDTNITQHLVYIDDAMLSGLSKVEQPTNTSKTPPPSNVEKPLETPPPPASTTSSSSISSHSYAKLIGFTILDICGDTIDNNNRLHYLTSLLRDPSFTKPIDQYIESLQLPDSKNDVIALLDNIDCKVLLSYLSSNGNMLSGVALANRFAFVIKHAAYCTKYGNPEQFKKCFETAEPHEKNTVTEEEMEAIQQHQEDIERAEFTDVMGELLEEEGLTPVENYKQASDLVKYFASLMKRYGVNTTNYYELSKKLSYSNLSTLSSVKEEIDKLPLNDREKAEKFIVNLLAMFSHYNLTSAAREQLFHALNIIVLEAISSPDPGKFISVLSGLTMNILNVDKSEQVKLLTMLNRIVEYTLSYPVLEQESIINSLSLTLDKLIEYKQKYPEFSSTYLKTALAKMLASLEGTVSSHEEMPTPSQESSVTVQPKQVETNEEKVQAEPEIENGIPVVTRQDIVDYIKTGSPCSFVIEGHKISGQCSSILYMKISDLNLVFLPFKRQIYVLPNDKFGDEASKNFEALVKNVRNVYAEKGIVGTKLGLMLVSDGGNILPKGALFPFIPFMRPTMISMNPVYVYTPQTLPIAYYHTKFIDMVDFDEDSHLLYSDVNHDILLIGTGKFSKGDVVELYMTMEGPKLGLWGEKITQEGLRRRMGEGGIYR